MLISLPLCVRDCAKTTSCTCHCDKLCQQSGSVSTTMAGKRKPPSASREYTPLSTLTLGQPEMIEDSWGVRRSDRACEKRAQEVVGCTEHLTKWNLEQVAWRHLYLLEATLLLQQRHLRPQLLQLTELSLGRVGYRCGQGSSRPVFPHSICFRRTKAASLWPPSIPCFPL